ncbi:MAG: type III-D CRISPR-associated protein Csx19, partial [Blastocatellia bacterium]
NFWGEHQDTQLRRCDEAALLWGQRKTQGEGSANTWQEDRVGWARLDYPGIVAERVQVVYEVFMEDGQPTFVWWKELQPYV